MFEYGSCIDKFKNVAQWYKTLLYGLGYVSSPELGDPLVRKNRPTAKPYYQIRTFSFNSFLPFYTAWYKDGVKVIPSDIEIYLTPRCLAIWIMGDGSGMADGGFKLSSHSFSKEENLLLSLQQVFKDKKILPLPEGYKFDFIGQGKLIELKSRTCRKDRYETTCIGVGKIEYAKQHCDKDDFYFVFNFTDGLYYWKYNKEQPLMKCFIYDIQHYLIPINYLLPMYIE